MLSFHISHNNYPHLFIIYLLFILHILVALLFQFQSYFIRISLIIPKTLWRSSSTLLHRRKKLSHKSWRHDFIEIIWILIKKIKNYQSNVSLTNVVALQVRCECTLRFYSYRSHVEPTVEIHWTRGMVVNEGTTVEFSWFYLIYMKNN